MSIVPLSCPKCGGSLEVDEFATKTKCPFCGTEHAIHNDGYGAIQLEFHARCPRCKRNDQSKVLAAVNRESTPLADLLNPPPQPPHFDTIPDSLEPGVVQRLERIQRRNLVELIIVLTVYVTLSAMALFFGNAESGVRLSSTTVITLLAAVFAYKPVTTRLEYRKTKAHLLSGLNSRRKHMLETNRIYDETISRWEASMAIWQRLYYCYRDDCVFMPNTERCCPPNHLSRFIEALLKDEQG